MGLWAWPVLLLSALAAGALLVVVLIVPRRWDLVALLGVALCLTLGFQGLLAIIASSSRADVGVAAAGVAAGVAVGGYGLAAALLARRRPRFAQPVLEPAGVARDGAPKKAVIVLAAAEPSRYRFETVNEELADLLDAGVQLPSDATLPIFYAAKRDAYRALGASDAPAAVQRVARRLETLIRDTGGPAVCVPVALTDAPPRLGEVVSSLASEGVEDVVVVPLAVGASFRTDKALSELDALHPSARGISVSESYPRWASCGLPEFVADRVKRVTHIRRSVAGVVLLSEGRPEPWDRVQPEAAIEETTIVQRVRALLIDAGYDPSRILPASLEWREPDAATMIRRLLDTGSPQVILAPATVPVDGTVTLVELRELAWRIGRASGAEVTVLPAWGDAPVVAGALLDAVRARMAPGAG